ncbi:hypothetical protein SAMN02745121_05102 [Nannocystis exedens]|uniref:Uncharacterized protein n=1 Tax=Nannocystis exedens TaxID=54 RepID=A0A1I2CFH2_9BACT|nr:hypothetical protein [Nannocystis exedens]PCC68331.1 hypothetical protein NAEX_01341 [Nannocystis exedens]SFE66855.1 hypothetical protein SAMN02745121_05102 [Nannocystis exedens]
MAERELSLCTTCGTWSPDGAARCGHARDPRLSWLRPPWWDGLGDLLRMALFTVLCAAALMSIGPLLWWLYPWWPPESPLHIAGAIGIGIVTAPGWVFGIGLVLAIPEHYRGRCWHLRDAAGSDDDRAAGHVFVRVRAPVRGGLVRTVRSPLPLPDCSDMSSEAAAQRTGDPQLVVAAALAGLAARGRIALTRVDTGGWRLRRREPPLVIRSAAVHVRSLSPRTADDPWLEGALLDQLADRPDVELRQPLRALLRRLGAELGYAGGDELPRPRWPADAGTTPALALRALLLDRPPGPDEPAAVRAVLAAWRARDPERVAPVLELVASLTAELLPAPAAAGA